MQEKKKKKQWIKKETRRSYNLNPAHKHKNLNSFSEILTDVSNLFHDLVIEHKKTNSNLIHNLQSELDEILINYIESKIEPLFKVNYNHVFFTNRKSIWSKKFIRYWWIGAQNGFIYLKDTIM